MIDKTKAMILMDRWQDTYRRNTELYASVGSIFGSNPECEFGNTIWHAFDRHTEALAAALGDTDGWLGWYAHENDFGANGFGASPPNGKFRKVKTLAALYKIIIESRA